MADVDDLLAAGRLAALGELAAGAAHELNNPLFAVLGLVEFLLADAEPGTREHERLQLVQQSALEMKDIVRAVLEFARTPDGPATVPLQELTERTVRLMRLTTAGHGLELVVRLEAPDTLVEARPAELGQLVLHLLLCARAASGEEGTVTVALARDGDTVVLTVGDTGPALAEEALPNRFGLEAARAVAGRQGGELEVRPAGDGPRFALHLPAAG